MSKQESLGRYGLIIRKLKQKACSFQEIEDFLERESEIQSIDYSITKRTFQRDLNDIRELFKLEINFDKSRKVYVMEESAEPAFSERILEAFETYQFLQVSEKLSAFIHFEIRKSNGSEFLPILLHAIKNKKVVTFQYTKFTDSETSFRTVEPYLLKEFKNRWFILANDQKDDKIKSFSVDRISDLAVLKKKYSQRPAIDWHKKFQHCYGILEYADSVPQLVELSFNPFQGKFIKAMPLHASQQLVVDTETECRIQLNTYVTHELVMEILSFGPSVKVIKPQSLAKEICESYKESLKRYQKP